MSTLLLDGFVPLHGSEPVSEDGELIGSVTSAGYSYTLGQTIAFAFLPSEIVIGRALQIEAFGKSYDAETARRCLHDPEMKRLKS